MADQTLFAPVTIFDGNGDPVPGALATFYAAGTNSLITVYSDSAGTVPAANPVVADANGVMPQRFVTQGAKAVITDAGGATLYTLDPVATVRKDFGAASAITFQPTANIPSSSVQDAITKVDDNWRAAVNSINSTIGGYGDLVNDDEADHVAVQATWNTGTDTAENFISAKKLNDKLDNYRDAYVLGYGMQYRVVSRNANTAYQNTTGRTLGVLLRGLASSGNEHLYTSTDGTTWTDLGVFPPSAAISLTLPPGHYWKSSGSGSVPYAAELS